MNNNKKVRTRIQRIALGVGSASLCLAVLLIYLAIKKSKNFEKNGSKVEGVVTSAYDGGSEGGSARYKFHVEGREYSGSSKHYIPEGDRVLVTYLLSNPSENRVQDFEWYIDSSLYIFMSSGVGVAMLALGYSKRTADLMAKLGFSLDR